MVEGELFSVSESIQNRSNPFSAEVTWDMLKAMQMFVQQLCDEGQMNSRTSELPWSAQRLKKNNRGNLPFIFKFVLLTNNQFTFFCFSFTY